MATPILEGTAYAYAEYFGVTGLQFLLNILPLGGSWAPATGNVTDQGNGCYLVSFSAADMAHLPISFFATEPNGNVLSGQLEADDMLAAQASVWTPALPLRSPRSSPPMPPAWRRRRKRLRC